MNAPAKDFKPVPPVRKEIVIAAAPAHVFRVFTERLDAWWPRDHKIGQAALKRAVLEARPHGRWYEIGVDGSECEWGKVLVWEPPSRLVLAWQITGAWKFDPDFLTEIEVTFSAHGAGATRVVLEHRNLERFGGAAADIRATLDSAGGWMTHLERLAAAAA